MFPDGGCGAVFFIKIRSHKPCFYKVNFSRSLINRFPKIQEKFTVDGIIYGLPLPYVRFKIFILLNKTIITTFTMTNVKLWHSVYKYKTLFTLMSNKNKRTIHTLSIF